MCQVIAGNNNTQIHIGKQKAKNINNQFKLSDEQLSVVVDALKEQMELEYGVMRKDMESKILGVLDSVVKRIIAETYKEQCSSNPSVEELVITLDEFKSKANDITSKIQNIVQAQNDDRKKRNELRILQKEINTEINDLYRLCKDILSLVREVFAKVKELGVDENEIKQLVKYSVEVAEKQSAVIVSAIRNEHEFSSEILKQQKLDSAVIYEMFQLIKSLSSTGPAINGEEEGIVEKKISDQITVLADRLDKLDTILKSTEQMPGYLNYIIEKTNAVYNKICSTGVYVKQILIAVIEHSDKLNEILRYCNGQAKTDSLSNEERDGLIAGFTAQLASSEKRNKELEEIIVTLKNNGKKSKYPCPFCKNMPLEGRLVIGGYSKCELCGKQFLDIDPTCPRADDEWSKLTADVLKWRQKHTAELYRASGVPFAYNLKLTVDTISSAGIVIVPEQATGLDQQTKEQVTQIDKLHFIGERVRDGIKKLFVPKCITLSDCVQSQFPASEIVPYNWNE